MKKKHSVKYKATRKRNKNSVWVAIIFITIALSIAMLLRYFPITNIPLIAGVDGGMDTLTGRSRGGNTAVIRNSVNTNNREYDPNEYKEAQQRAANNAETQARSAERANNKDEADAIRQAAQETIISDDTKKPVEHNLAPVNNSADNPSNSLANPPETPSQGSTIDDNLLNAGLTIDDKTKKCIPGTFGCPYNFTWADEDKSCGNSVSGFYCHGGKYYVINLPATQKAAQAYYEAVGKQMSTYTPQELYNMLDIKDGESIEKKLDELLLKLHYYNDGTRKSILAELQNQLDPVRLPESDFTYEEDPVNPEDVNNPPANTSEEQQRTRKMYSDTNCGGQVRSGEKCQRMQSSANTPYYIIVASDFKGSVTGSVAPNTSTDNRTTFSVINQGAQPKASVSRNYIEYTFGKGATLPKMDLTKFGYYEKPVDVKGSPRNGGTVYVIPGTKDEWYNGSKCTQDTRSHCGTNYCNSDYECADDPSKKPTETKIYDVDNPYTSYTDEEKAVQTPLTKEQVHIENMQTKYDLVLVKDPSAFKGAKFTSQSSCEEFAKSKKQANVSCIPVPGENTFIAEYLIASKVNEYGIILPGKEGSTSLTATQTDQALETYNLIIQAGGKVETSTKCIDGEICIKVGTSKYGDAYYITPADLETALKNADIKNDVEYLYKYQQIIEKDPKAFGTFLRSQYVSKGYCDEAAHKDTCILVDDSNWIYKYLTYAQIDATAKALGIATTFTLPNLDPEITFNSEEDFTANPAAGSTLISSNPPTNQEITIPTGDAKLNTRVKDPSDCESGKAFHGGATTEENKYICQSPSFCPNQDNDLSYFCGRDGKIMCELAEDPKACFKKFYNQDLDLPTVPELRQLELPPTFQQDGLGTITNIDGYAITGSKEGCGPSTYYNYLQYVKKVVPDVNNIIETFSNPKFWACGKGKDGEVFCGSGAYAIAAEIYKYNDKPIDPTNRVIDLAKLDLSKLNDSNNTFVWGGELTKWNGSSLQHINLLTNCRNEGGKLACDNPDSKFSGENPAKCVQNGTDSMSCTGDYGVYTIHIGETTGTPDALYPVPVE